MASLLRAQRSCMPTHTCCRPGQRILCACGRDIHLELFLIYSFPWSSTDTLRKPILDFPTFLRFKKKSGKSGNLSCHEYLIKNKQKTNKHKTLRICFLDVQIEELSGKEMPYLTVFPSVSSPLGDPPLELPGTHIWKTTVGAAPKSPTQGAPYPTPVYI